MWCVCVCVCVYVVYGACGVCVWYVWCVCVVCVCVCMCKKYARSVLIWWCVFMLSIRELIISNTILGCVQNDWSIMGIVKVSINIPLIPPEQNKDCGTLKYISILPFEFLMDI